MGKNGVDREPKIALKLQLQLLRFGKCSVSFYFGDCKLICNTFQAAFSLAAAAAADAEKEFCSNSSTTSVLLPQPEIWQKAGKSKEEAFYALAAYEEVKLRLSHPRAP